MLYLQALALTIILEAPVFSLGLKGIRRGIFYCILFNCFSHPLAWLAVRNLPGGYWANLLLVEIAVFALETALLHYVAGLEKKRALEVSLAANFVSAAAGILISSAFR